MNQYNVSEHGWGHKFYLSRYYQMITHFMKWNIDQIHRPSSLGGNNSYSFSENSVLSL